MTAVKAGMRMGPRGVHKLGPTSNPFIIPKTFPWFLYIYVSETFLLFTLLLYSPCHCYRPRDSGCLERDGPMMQVGSDTEVIAPIRVVRWDGDVVLFGGSYHNSPNKQGSYRTRVVARHWDVGFLLNRFESLASRNSTVRLPELLYTGCRFLCTVR